MDRFEAPESDLCSDAVPGPLTPVPLGASRALRAAAMRADGPLRHDCAGPDSRA
jgi:hypothetical protein